MLMPAMVAFKWFCGSFVFVDINEKLVFIFPFGSMLKTNYCGGGHF